MDRDAAHWQPEVQDDVQELGLACYLFEASTAAFSASLKVLSTNSSMLDAASYSVLCNEFRKYYMWNEGFSTRSGGLDRALSESRNPKAIVLKLMAQWARAVCRVPSVFQSHDWSTTLPKLVDLEVLADKASQVAEATTAETRTQFFTANVSSESPPEFDSDLDSDTTSIRSDIIFEDIVVDLNTYIENLVDLTASLENPAKDVMLVEVSNDNVIEELSSIPEPIRPFVMIIRDQFPSAEALLVGKLGEANWNRRERLRQLFASIPTTEYAESVYDESSSIADTIRAPNEHSAAQSYQSNTDVSATYQSRTTASDFSESSLFDGNSITFHLRRNNSITESMTSFATSLVDGPEHGQRRIPKLPENHHFEDSLQCQLCGVVLRNIRNRADWRKHVYDDLQPYVCLFTDCNLGLHTFRSRREWINHEFQVHRVNQQWCCNLCKEVLSTQDYFRAHLAEIHQNMFLSSQIEEFMAASKRFVNRNIDEELCPFCLTAPSSTQRSFASHVGRHLQEISLAALPLLDAFSDDEDDGESSDDDDGDEDMAGAPSDDEEDNESSDDDNNNDYDRNDNKNDGDLAREKDFSYLSEKSNEKNDEHDAEGNLSHAEVIEPEKSSITDKILKNKSIPANTGFDHGLHLSPMVRDIVKFLAELKALWTTLEQLTLHQATAAQASYAYVKVEYEFNVVCENFETAQIDPSDFGNFPELLRHILEATLTEETTKEAKEDLLSRLRNIYLPLLYRLNQKLLIFIQNKYPYVKVVYDDTKNEFVPRSDSPRSSDLGWRVWYTTFRTEQKALLQLIGPRQPYTIFPNPVVTLVPHPGQIFQAGWDYEARFHDELSFKKGDFIELVQRENTCGPGWYLGRHRRNFKIGLFPAGFTRNISDDAIFSIIQTTVPPTDINSPGIEPMSKLIPLTNDSTADTAYQAQIGTLVVTIDSAKNLSDRKLFGKQEPYCVVRLGKESRRTETDRRGLQTSYWNQVMEFTIYDSLDYHKLSVSVFNNNKKTDLIGETLVDLREIIVPGGGGSSVFIWYKLHYTDKYAGEVRIQLKYNDTKGDQKKDSESSNRPIFDSEEVIPPAVPENTPLKAQVEVQRKEDASATSTSLGTIKVVLVGDAPRLKTNLLISFVTKKFPTVYSQTVFENYEAPILIEDKLYNLAFSDTAGQENYDLLRRITYQNGNVFLVCAALGVREQYESAKSKWAPELKEYCRGIPFILVGIRQPPDGDDEVGQGKMTELGQEVELEYGRKIAKEIGALTYLECDISTRQGMQDVFEQAVLAALGRHPVTKKLRRLSQILFRRKTEN